MNGATALVRTLVDSGIEVCFGNPGTSELHFLNALDDGGMRGVLGLAEGVVTGAADGYARVAGKPAATLLHLGPGLTNGMANLHNARRAHTPIVNIVGDHATHHKPYDAPLESDIDTLAESLRGWTCRCGSTVDVGTDAAAAVSAAAGPPGRVATLILPADVSWHEGAEPAEPVRCHAREPVPTDTLAATAELLRGDEETALLIGGEAGDAASLEAATRIGQATGTRTFLETFPPRLERGAGLPTIERLGYLPDQAAGQLDGVKHLIVAGARPPVAFFAYPDKASSPLPDDAVVHTLARPGADVAGALLALAERTAPDVTPAVAEPHRPRFPAAELTSQNWPEVIGALLPEGAIISDEANTSGLSLAAATAGAPPHEILSLTGGAIGQGIPVATGAAIAAPHRPVINLQADGSAMYSISALWTQARENADVTTVLLNNSAYAILRMELQHVAAGPAGANAASLLDLSAPEPDFVRIAEGFGVPATRATTTTELAGQFRDALAEAGPHLIDARIPPLV